MVSASLPEGRMKRLFLLLSMLMLVACAQQQPPPPPPAPPPAPPPQAQPSVFHVYFAEGSATLTPEARQIVEAAAAAAKAARPGAGRRLYRHHRFGRAQSASVAPARPDRRQSPGARRGSAGADPGQRGRRAAGTKPGGEPSG